MGKGRRSSALDEAGDLYAASEVTAVSRIRGTQGIQEDTLKNLGHGEGSVRGGPFRIQAGGGGLCHRRVAKVPR